MRTLVVAISLMAIFGLGAGAQQTDAPKVCVLKVSGMSCSACAKTVEKEAKKINGVKSAKVSQPNGQAEITYDPAKTSPVFSRYDIVSTGDRRDEMRRRAAAG